MNFFEAVNAWISSNQALVVSVGIPVFTLAITGWASFLSHRAKVSEVKLSGRLKLSEYRQSNFEELLKLSARLQSLFVAEASKTLAIKDDKGLMRSDDLLEVIECGNNFLLRARAEPDQVSDFSHSINNCCKMYFTKTKAFDPASTNLVDLRQACKRILDHEWFLIERELKGLA